MGHPPNHAVANRTLIVVVENRGIELLVPNNAEKSSY
jgi:hypothetical protein